VLNSKPFQKKSPELWALSFYFLAVSLNALLNLLFFNPEEGKIPSIFSPEGYFNLTVGGLAVQFFWFSLFLCYAIAGFGSALKQRFVFRSVYCGVFAFFLLQLSRLNYAFQLGLPPISPLEEMSGIRIWQDLTAHPGINSYLQNLVWDCLLIVVFPLYFISRHKIKILIRYG